MALDTTARVRDHLRRLKDLNDARELFSDLNYEVISPAPLPRFDWPGEARDALLDDPKVIARHGDFHIIYSRLASPRLERNKEREVINRLIRDHRYALFLFSDDDASDWHFVNVKYDDDVTRRRVFQRYTIGPDERLGDRLRTISEQISKLALADEELDRLEREPLEIQRRYDHAFDVETVTKQFYREYRRVFEAIEASIRGFGDDHERKRLFTQRLFNRLMFMAFIQKKGWLRFPGQTGSDYLSALWDAYDSARNDEPGGNFYEDRLKRVFEALNTRHGNDDSAARRGSFIETLIGRVPYLNGGLFEYDDDDRRSDIVVPDESVHLILSTLFERFNFTITESTPLDIEVAVDPEMLGKVFEELVTGRHESGSYYTPKPIVSFMCRESLKGYLQSALAGESAAAIEQFVDEHDPSRLRNPEAVLDALKRVRACDPACGSGAYLLGMLHELIELRGVLFATRSLDPVTNYQRKLEVIEHNLYGVDNDPFAVNIARLRLWLSLAVEFDGPSPQPLPNLDFKIECGDSVLGPEPPHGMQQSWRKDWILRYQQLKSDYLTAHSDRKRSLQSQIAKAKSEIMSWTSGGAPVRGFDWAVEFAEVFADGGFDIVLANPPYVRQELITDIKPTLKDVYKDLYSGTADLYVYFYYRALQLLRPGGMLAFISSNKWFRANYGKKLRARIAKTASVLSITDFGDLPVFESATAYPMIFVASTDGRRGQTRYTVVPSLDPPYPDVKAVISEYGRLLPDDALQGESWTLTDETTAKQIQIMTAAGTTLGEYVNGKIYRGVLTGFNKAFVIDGKKRAELIAADPKSAEIIKPFVGGRDISRWRLNHRDRWLIFAQRGVTIGDYPAIQAHLEQWRADLTPKQSRDVERGRKPGNYKWYEIQDSVAYYQYFDRPKIVFPDISKEPRFALDREGIFLHDTTFFIPVDDLFLLGLLNSEVVLRLYSEMSPEIRGGFLRYKRQYVKKIPVPTVSAADRNAVEELVSGCLQAALNGGQAPELEAEINARVARLYGLKGEGDKAW